MSGKKWDPFAGLSDVEKITELGFVFGPNGKVVPAALDGFADICHNITADGRLVPNNPEALKNYMTDLRESLARLDALKKPSPI